MPKATTPIAKTIFDGVFTQLFMIDKNGHELSIGDTVLFDFYEIGGHTPTIVIGTILNIRPIEAQVGFNFKRWRWVGSKVLEYATPEKLFLHKLEN